ncbi:MAG: M1 family metallopeptidase, partial [Myxococcales bacterium]|nr:M1 family metallopeptidase [Myxococcales bacterium]
GSPTTTQPRWAPVLGGVAAACALGGCSDPADSEPIVEDAAPGAAGIGDPLFPTLGNGGYDVSRYQLALRYATSAPTQPLQGALTMVATATQSLSQFHLDFAGDSVGRIEVDGRDATVVREGEELVITPARPIGKGQSFRVEIEQFAATPRTPDPMVLLGAPFFRAADGSGWVGQPNAAHQIYPCNDHPSDKASFAFSIDVPEGTVAVASGVLTGQSTANGRTTWSYEQEEPMATELAQVAVGAQTVIDRGERAGVLVRDVVPTRLVADVEPKLALELTQLDWMTAQVGPYPFRTYGSLLVDARLGFAFESQTLSLYDSERFAVADQRYAGVMMHELAHQWFGNSVAPARWADVWLNEGHATWYETLYRFQADPALLIARMKQVYEIGDELRAASGPVASPREGTPRALFNSNVYVGGALVLFALRQQVGVATFEAIERAWAERYRGRSASTADYIALASETAAQDLTPFLTSWLYALTTPPMPGFPDWTVRPPGSAIATAAAVAALPDISCKRP